VKNYLLVRNVRDDVHTDGLHVSMREMGRHVSDVQAIIGRTLFFQVKYKTDPEVSMYTYAY
jgi:hypothetical protein